MLVNAQGFVLCGTAAWTAATLQRSSFGSLTMVHQHFAIFSQQNLASLWCLELEISSPLLLRFAQEATVISMVDLKDPYSLQSHSRLLLLYDYVC